MATVIRTEAQLAGSRVVTPPDNLKITVVISNILSGVNLEDGGTNNPGLVYGLHRGGEDDTLVTAIVLQDPGPI